MLTHNLDTSDGLTNGATCVIKHIGQSPNPASVRPVIIWVLFDDQYVGKNRRMEYKNLYRPIISHDWTPILEISRKFTVGRYQNIHFIRKQFPFQPASAVTVHKAQGSSLDQVIISFKGFNQAHMVCVALSRSRKLSGLHLLDFTPKSIIVDPKVEEEMRVELSGGFTPCRHLRPSSGREHTIVTYSVR